MIVQNIWNNWPNFKPNEFKCGCGCQTDIYDIDENLMTILQYIRNKYGTVNITSGYRCQAYNDTLEGSVKNSDHVKKKAADGYVPKAKTLDKRKEIIKEIRYFPGFKYAYCDGYILYADGTEKKYNAPWMSSSIHISVK